MNKASSSPLRLVCPDGRAFAFFLELDNSTESIRSQVSLDSWQRKIRFYERYQDAKTERFRVLAITTGALRADCRVEGWPGRWLVHG